MKKNVWDPTHIVGDPPRIAAEGYLEGFSQKKVFEIDFLLQKVKVLVKNALLRGLFRDDFVYREKHKYVGLRESCGASR